jgi:uncharacterized protein (UPF0332 family)
MPFADDLLEQAQHLSHREDGEPKQASLRRAVSTAYYALFHLLIDDAVSQWAIEHQRRMLARTFDHGAMKATCNELVKAVKGGAQRPQELYVVAQAFMQLQQHRHDADYDIGKIWTRTDVENVLELANEAFTSWMKIRTDEAAQNYLLNLLIPKLQAR